MDKLVEPGSDATADGQKFTDVMSIPAPKRLSDILNKSSTRPLPRIELAGGAFGSS